MSVKMESFLFTIFSQSNHKHCKYEIKNENKKLIDKTNLLILLIPENIMKFSHFLYPGSLVEHDWLGVIVENKVFSLGIFQITYNS